MGNGFGMGFPANSHITYVAAWRPKIDGKGPTDRVSADRELSE
jgi:hypothetical protein